jgi:hypothetical protein
MEKLDREYEIVRPQVENGESFVHCNDDGVAIVSASNGRPTAMPPGDFVASGRYEQGTTAWIQKHEFPVLNRHVGENGRTPIGCQTCGG